MSYIDRLIATRSSMNNMLLIEKNRDARLLQDADRAYLGCVMHGDKFTAAYDSQIANAMGLDPEAQAKLTDVAFLLQAHLTLDNAALAVMHYLESNELVKVPEIEGESRVTRESMQASAEIAEAFFSLIGKAMEHGLDVGACVSQALAEKKG